MRFLFALNLTPMNDQDRISPWAINAMLTRQVMRTLYEFYVTQ